MGRAWFHKTNSARLQNEVQSTKRTVPRQHLESAPRGVGQIYRTESTGESACRTFYKTKVSGQARAPVAPFYKTNYAAAVITFPFAGTGWRRDWSFRSWLRLIWKFFVIFCS